MQTKWKKHFVSYFCFFAPPPTPTKTWQRSGLIWVIVFKHVLLVRLWSMATGVERSAPRLSSKTYWCHPLVIKENAPLCSTEVPPLRRSLWYRLYAHVAFSSALACHLLASVSELTKCLWWHSIWACFPASIDIKRIFPGAMRESDSNWSRKCAQHAS